MRIECVERETELDNLPRNLIGFNLGPNFVEEANLHSSSTSIVA
jgi:hypothetical protein